MARLARSVIRNSSEEVRAGFRSPRKWRSALGRNGRMSTTPGLTRRRYSLRYRQSLLRRVDLILRSEAMNAVVEQMGSDTTAMRPFHVDVPDADLTELRRRIKSTRFPEKEPVADMSQGVPPATVEKLAHYWANHYDWRKCEARINAFSNFITEIDGVDIDFIHACSKHENALPIIISHGWPYSVLALLKIIEPLTVPTAYGGTASKGGHFAAWEQPKIFTEELRAGFSSLRG